MRFYVLNEWCSIETETEKPFCRCVIGHATEDDEWNDGQNSYSVNGGFDFNIYDTIKDAIISSGYRPSKITFEDLTDAELAEANSIVNSLSNDAAFMAKFQPEEKADVPSAAVANV